MGATIPRAGLIGVNADSSSPQSSGAPSPGRGLAPSARSRAFAVGPVAGRDQGAAGSTAAAAVQVAGVVFTGLHRACTRVGKATV